MASEAAKRVCKLEGCDVSFTPTRSTQRFCRTDHARQFHNDNQKRRQGFADRICERQGCGNTYTPNRKNARYCSRACASIASNAMQRVEPPELDDVELVRLAEERGWRIDKPEPVIPVVDFDTSRIRGDRVRLAVISDTHAGSKYQQPTYMREFLQYAKKQKVSAVLHCGDLTDGPFRRHRNPHEVWLHTWQAMAEYSADPSFMPDIGIPYYFISGNHDDWFLDDGGGDVVATICDKRDDFTYLGPMQAFMRFGDVRVEMFHPNEGGAYALSYKLQKHIEGMSPEEKPNIYLAGNYHKSIHVPGYRNVEGFLLPAYQSRTHWMRGKRLASIVGGIILDIGLTPRGLAPSLKVEWVLEREPLVNDWG